MISRERSHVNPWFFTLGSYNFFPQLREFYIGRCKYFYISLRVILVIGLIFSATAENKKVYINEVYILNMPH